MRWSNLSGWMLVAALATTACNNKDGKGPPQPASAASQPSFAEGYGETLQLETESFDGAKQEVTDAAQGFSGYADALKDPCDYAKAEEVVRAADEAGRSEAYVEKARQRDAVQAFFQEDDQARLKRVAGGVQYAAKQAGCNDVGNTAVGTIKRQIEKELDETTRDGNEAHAMLDRYEEALGKDNVATMREQVDTVAEASYLTHIELPTRKHELERHVAAGAEARKTLEREIEAEQKRAADAGTSDAGKKAAEARAAKLEEAKGKLDVQLEEAKTRLKTLEKDVKDTKKAYDEALDGLLASLRKKAEAGGES